VIWLKTERLVKQRVNSGDHPTGTRDEDEGQRYLCGNEHTANTAQTASE
jgi:hypothetical protein